MTSLLQLDFIDKQPPDARSKLTSLQGDKKNKLQEVDLRWQQKQKVALQEELESVKKELQSMKQAMTNQRIRNLNLRDQLDQVIKERDAKWLASETECSALREMVSQQQSSLRSKDCQCQEQQRQIHLLRLENKKIKKELDFKQRETEYQKQQLQRSQDELQSLRAVPRKVVRVQGKPCMPVIRRPMEFVQDSRALKKELRRRKTELHTATEELRRTQQRCEEMKLTLTCHSVTLQQCQAQLRKQKTQTMALTGERDTYRRELEKQRRESGEDKQIAPRARVTYCMS